MNKVLIITPGFAANENDSSSVPYLQDYLLALRNAIGAENIRIMALQYPFVNETYYWNGIEVIPMNGKNKGGLKRIFNWGNAIKRGIDICKKGQFAIHAFWLSEAAFIGQRIAKKSGSPFIITMMGTDALAKSNLVRFIHLDQFPLIALSQNQANAFHIATGKKVTDVIPLPFDRTFPEHDAVDRNIDILFNGSFIEIKQPKLFIEIISALQKNRPALRALMIGDGPLKASCMQMVRELGLDDIIRFTGTLPRENVFEHMQRAKILLHTSGYEGQCHSFLEAFACGMYVVSFDVGRVEMSEKHIISVNKSEMTEQLNHLLETAVNFKPYNFVHGADIVSKYSKLYQFTN